MHLRYLATLLLLILLYGCRNNKRPVLQEKPDTVFYKTDTLVMQYKEIAIRVNQVVYCSYPANDPVYLHKKSTRLVLVDISVSCNQRIQEANRAFIIPTGATLWDRRGNEYEASPQVIAMAQNNHCIKGDDIESYNAIWNASLKAGETKRAFVLGFELPEDATPSKICWNKAWLAHNLFFRLER